MGADNLFSYMDVAATNVSIGYKNRTFYCEMLAPAFPVEKPTGRIWLFGKEKFRLYETIRGMKSEAREVADWSLGNIPYMTTGHSLRAALDDAQASAADPGIDWEITTTENLTQSIIVRQEYDVYNAIVNNAGPEAFGTAVPSTSLSGTNRWDDYTNSDPIAAVENQKTTILNATGALANTFCVGFPVYQVLRQHPRILDRFKYTQRGILQAADLKDAFSVDNFWVLDSLYDSVNEGIAPSLTTIWGKNAILAVVPPAPQKREVALAYTVFWTFQKTAEGTSLSAPTLEGNRGYIVRRYRQETKRSDVLEIDKWYDVVTGDVNAGYVFKTCVT